MSDLHLLAARYAQDVKLGIFSKEDFKRLLLPHHEHYNGVLKTRRSNKRDSTFGRHDCFNLETQKAHVNLWQTYLRVEEAYESLR